MATLRVLIFLCVLAIPIFSNATDLSSVALPLSFEVNRGQAPDETRFLARSKHGTVALTDAGVILGAPDSSHAVILRLLESSGTQPTGESPTGGVVNYYISRSRTGWLEHIPVFAHVRYKNVYPGVDVVFHGRGDELEFDFEIQPGSSPTDIVLGIEGSDRLAVNSDGALDINAGGEHWRLLAPAAYQIHGGATDSVATSYVLLPGNRVQLRVGPFDGSAKLIIDPILEYSFVRTYGTGPRISGMQVDSSGNIVIAGDIAARDYPVVNGQAPSPYGNDQVFVTKLNGADKSIIFSTYIPASSFSWLRAFTIDSGENIYLAGATGASDFPLTSTNLGVCSSSCYAGFVTKLAPDGTMAYSTLLASGQVIPNSITVDSTGSAYIAGFAADNSLQTVNAFQGSYQGLGCAGCSDAFFAKLNPFGTNYIFASYFGAPSLTAGGEVNATGIGIDGSGNVFLGGLSSGGDIPLLHQWQSVQGTFFLTKFAGDGKTLLFSTLLGTASRDFPKLRVGSDGTIYLAGTINSHDFPYTINAAFHPTEPNFPQGDTDSIFAMAVSPTLQSLKYSTYLGDGRVTDIATDIRGHLYIAGARGLNFVPLVNPVASDNSSGGFFLELDNAGNPVIISEVGGHEVQQIPTGIAVDTSHSVYLAGSANSVISPNMSVFGPDPLLVGPPCDGVPAGQGAVLCAAQTGIFIAKVNISASSPQLSVTSPGPALNGLTGPFLFLRNTGSSTLHIGSIVLSSGLLQRHDNCATALLPGASCTLSVTDSQGRVAGGTVTITSDAQPSSQTFIVNGPPFPPLNPIGDWPYFEDVNFAFPPQMAGTSSGIIPLHIWNLGTENSHIDAATTFGDVAQTNDCALLVPGAGCSVQVWTTSQGNIPNQLAIVFDTNVNTSSHSGTGGWEQDYYIYENISPQQLLLSTPSMTFGHQLVGGTAISRAVTVTNTGNTALSAPAVSIQGASEFRIAGNQCTATLGPHSSCFVAVKFVPITNGDRQAKLVVSGSTQGDLFGTGEIDSVVHVSPLQLDFWPVIVSNTATQALVLTNTSASSVGIANIAISSSEFTETNDCGTQLLPAGTCTVQITFAPQRLGLRTGTIDIGFSGGVVQQSVGLSGTGVTPLTVSPTTLTFPATAVGSSSKSQGVSIGNGRQGGSQAYTLAVSGDFIIASNPCPNPLPGFWGCALQLAFQPAALGARAGTLTISYPGLSVQSIVTLSGTGGTAAIQVPASADFGMLLLGATVQQKIILANPGAVDLTITGVALAGNNSSEFQIADNQCSTLSPGATCTVSVNFVPIRLGAKSATLVVTDNAPDSPQSLLLSGSGTNLPFAFQSQPGSTTGTVTAGSTAVYQLSVNRTTGFYGSIQLSCSGLPVHSTCSIQPSSVDMSQSATANFVVRVLTGTSRAEFRISAVPIFAAAMLCMPLLITIRSRRTWLILVAAGLLLTFLIACGGGGSTAAPGPSTSNTTPPGKYTFNLVGVAGDKSEMLPLSLVVN